MKSFDDFVHGLSAEDFAAINSPVEDAFGTFNISNPEEASEFFNRLIASNRASTLLLLSKYHEWLMQDLF